MNFVCLMSCTSNIVIENFAVYIKEALNAKNELITENYSGINELYVLKCEHIDIYFWYILYTYIVIWPKALKYK